MPAYILEHGEAPTVDDLVNIYQMAMTLEEPGEDANEAQVAQYQKNVALIQWCVDDWLPVTPGWDDYPVSIRPHRPWIHEGHDVNGVKKAYVNAASEASGLVFYENYRTAWINKAAWKRNNRSKGKKKSAQAIPTYNRSKPSTFAYKALWSDCKGPGWDQDAYTKYNEHLKRIVEFRKKDKENGWKVHLKMHAMVAKNYNLGDEEGVEPPNKKQKTGAGDDGSVESLAVDLMETDD